MKLVVALGLVLSTAPSSVVFAKDPKAPARPGYQTVDLGAPPAPVEAPKSGVNVSSSCENPAGQKFNQGQAGFDTCLIENTHKANTRQEEINRQRKQNP